MPFGLLLLAWLALGSTLRADSICDVHAPCYVPASIVNAASNVNDSFAPNAFITIYGTGLAYSTRALSATDLRGGLLPTSLGGVSVRIGSFETPMYYVSPDQVNALIPSDLLPGEYDVVIVREGRAGPVAHIRLRDVSPALFQIDPNSVIATHPDGSLVSRASPAVAGETIILYATGLGRTTLDTPSHTFYEYREIPMLAASIQHLDSFRILLDGVPVEGHNIAYAGIAPGFAGLYQINLLLPTGVGPNPEIRLSLDGIYSPENLHISLR